FKVVEPLEQTNLFLKVMVLLSENFPYKVDLHTKKVEIQFEGSKEEILKLKGNPEKYLDVYIVPEELESSEIKGMNKNQDPPKELPLKVNISQELSTIRIRNPERLQTVKFYLIQKSKD
ncbi:MAG: hypothetical protein D6785_07840, partial [Planctomycetota bacterium]